MSTKNNIARLTIEIPKPLHKKIKRMATDYEISLKQIVIDALESLDCPHGSHEPNDETLRVIKEAKNKKNLVSEQEGKDFLKQLISKCSK